MSCDNVLASAGSCEAALLGKQELARINEDAKVTAQLLALMARHTTLMQSTQDAIWHHRHTLNRSFSVKTQEEHTCNTFTRAYIATHIGRIVEVTCVQVSG